MMANRCAEGCTPASINLLYALFSDVIFVHFLKVQRYKNQYNYKHKNKKEW
ncbi:hypothetical protein HMPREF0650_1032 [Hoylesella buccalis ATCC 35310]|uniref:Uncharacterized protein n=1 Tax=Hoylesella buccalis ATCC 35310 TaxID=679190 RepID=D1W341_9BACT|nr:hypothetical protein HMPREF0650_1032 [Hoylesella buccalis ATCC 35310]